MGVNSWMAVVFFVATLSVRVSVELLLLVRAALPMQRHCCAVTVKQP